MDSIPGANDPAQLTGAERPDSAPIAEQLPRDVLLRVACLVVASTTAVPGLVLMSPIWERSEFFSHGYLIPLIALYLLYRRRTELRVAFLHGTPGRFGALALVFAAGFQVLAVVGDVIFAAGIGVPLVLLAACYAVAGRELVRVVALPIGFLVFMVPPPGLILNEILFRLKLAVTAMSVSLLHAFDYPIAAAGNQLMLPGHTLFVADACSGLTSIVTLIPLAAIIAYLLSHGVWRRLIILACVVPIAMAANVLRVIVTVLAVPVWGSEIAQGLLHETFGVSTYIIGTLALLGIARALR